MATALTPYGEDPATKRDERDAVIPLASKAPLKPAPGSSASAIPLATAPTYATTTSSTSGPGNYLGRTIAPGPATDRIELAKRSWDTFEKSTAPQYEASLDAARRRAGGNGQLFSGMFRTELGDLANQRALALDTERQSLIDKAVADSIADQYANIAIAQQQQGFQAAQQQSANTQGLQREQLDLAKTTGLGGLSLAEKQFGLSERQAADQLTLARADRTGRIQTGVDANGNPIFADTLSGQQFALASKLGLGNLSLEESKAKLNEKVALGQLSIEEARQALSEKQALIQQDQFAKQLEQALAVATMGDKTANRGIDAQSALAQNELYLKIASLLASMGYGPNKPPPGTTPPTPPPPALPPPPTPPNKPRDESGEEEEREER